MSFRENNCTLEEFARDVYKTVKDGSLYPCEIITLDEIRKNAELTADGVLAPDGVSYRSSTHGRGYYISDNFFNIDMALGRDIEIYIKEIDLAASSISTLSANDLAGIKVTLYSPEEFINHELQTWTWSLGFLRSKGFNSRKSQGMVIDTNASQDIERLNDVL